MTKRMLIDATHAEETRVVVLDGNRLEDFDVETSTKRQLKGNIYLAKVVRVEPSLQAAFVEYGGNRHGFLAFGEIHPDYYQIPVADRQRLLELAEEEARAEQAEEDAAAEADGRFHHASPGADPLPVDAPSEPEAIGTEPHETPAHDDTPEQEAAATEPVADPTTETFGSDPAEPAPLALGESQPPYAMPATMVTEIVTAPFNTEPAVQLPPAEPQNMPENPAELGADLAPEVQEPAAPAQAAMREADTGDEEGEADEEAPPPETVGGYNTEETQERRPPPRFLRNYKIQEVIRRRQILLVQVVKEERGTKGAALTTYISLAGRYCVLMPNSPRGGGISRKITNAADRKRLREVMAELDIPRGMGLIVRTAGANRPKPEIKRDCEYLMRLWDEIRERTLASVAPALIYEEANLIKRAIRDVYSRDVDEVLVDGEPGWKAARDFMRMLMPSHAKKVTLWRNGGQPLFSHEHVEAQLDAMLSPTVQLRSGGYLVINQAEALVAIDVNSGRSTRERGIEETALRTNLEAAEEVARQLRLRDLAGLIVIDFIDMESRKHNAMVERRLKDALKNDRARIQVGHISHFGLLEMSRQRLRPSLAETAFATCPHCGGTGHVRSTESSALHVLRAIEEEGAKRRAAEIVVHVASNVALYILNHKRVRLAEIEARTGMRVSFSADDSLVPPQLRIERIRTQVPDTAPAAIRQEFAPPQIEEAGDEETPAEATTAEDEETAHLSGEGGDEASDRRRRRRRRRRRGRREDGQPAAVMAEEETSGEAETDLARESTEQELPAADAAPEGQDLAESNEEAEPGRRRGRRGRRGRREEAETAPLPYSGPTPADPFGGHAFDLFDAIEAVAERGLAAAPEAAAPEAPEPLPEAEPPAEAAANWSTDEPPVSAENDVPAENPAQIETIAAEPATTDGAEQQAEPAPEPVIKPILITEEPPPEVRRHGWWRR